VKVPVLINWGKKIAFVIDRYFFENINRLDDAFPTARNDRARRDNAETGLSNSEKNLSRTRSWPKLSQSKRDGGQN
jgi:hypothetical protein